MSKPVKVFKMGAARASIFNNIILKNGNKISLPKVVIEVRYRDKSGQWRGTNSLSINDLPKAITALQKAYEYLLDGSKKKESESQEDGIDVVEEKAPPGKLFG